MRLKVRLHAGLRKRFDNHVQTLGQEIVLASKMLVEGGAADIGAPRDVARADVFVALCQQQFVECRLKGIARLPHAPISPLRRRAFEHFGHLFPFVRFRKRVALRPAFLHGFVVGCAGHSVGGIMREPEPVTRDRADMIAAVLIGAGALLSLLVVLHHPALHDVHGALDTARAVQGVGDVDRLVHGSLLLLIAAQAIGFFYFTSRLGFRNPAAFAGFFSYAAGSVVMVIPAILDGFVTPDLADKCLKSTLCGASQFAAFPVIAVIIQDFTKAALVAMSLATLLWSIALLGRGGVALGVGLAGLVCSIAPMAVLLLSDIYLRPGNLAAILMAQSLWNLSIAFVMVKGVAL